MDVRVYELFFELSQYLFHDDSLLGAGCGTRLETWRTPKFLGIYYGLSGVIRAYPVVSTLVLSTILWRKMLLEYFGIISHNWANNMAQLGLSIN
jgi:hypothetical protein